LEVFRAEEAGGAAAEVEGLESGIFRWLQIPLNPPLRKWETSCFLQDGLDVRGHRGLAVGEGIEVAVAAFPDAERDVDIKAFHSESPLTLLSPFALERSLPLLILGK
jgi:hypothetical protein